MNKFKMVIDKLGDFFMDRNRSMLLRAFALWSFMISVCAVVSLVFTLIVVGIQFICAYFPAWVVYNIFIWLVIFIGCCWLCGSKEKSNA